MNMYTSCVPEGTLINSKRWLKNSDLCSIFNNSNNKRHKQISDRTRKAVLGFQGWQTYRVDKIIIDKGQSENFVIQIPLLPSPGQQGIEFLGDQLFFFLSRRVRHLCKFISCSQANRCSIGILSCILLSQLSTTQNNYAKGACVSKAYSATLQKYDYISNPNCDATF